MDSLDALPDLTHAEDPISWARENLAFVGEGGTAVVFAHPDRPGLVVRISDYPDGWFGYAMALSDVLVDDPAHEVAEAVSRHAPAVLDMRFLDREEGSFHVALCERLSPVDDEDVSVEVARAILATPFPPCLDAGDASASMAHARDWAAAAVAGGRVEAGAAAAFLEAQPSFLVLAQALPDRFRDHRDGNWMTRGAHLVLNDPSRTMSPTDEARFRGTYGTAAGPSPKAGR